ncbi:MAG: hypothetical protein ACJ71Q_12865 [Terriglobales bacterium]
MAFSAGLAQQRTPSAESKPGPMPQDRIADSYAIYSQLLPRNRIEWGNAPRSQWLVEDTTTAMPLDQPCESRGMMNPHQGIKPPQERQAEFAEVLADYDAHCHDRYQLDGSKFRLRLPVRLLDEGARKRYVSGVWGHMPPSNNIMQAPPTPDEFKGAAGMHSFTAVYFNREHTLAMTEIGMDCGNLCGNWAWAVLEKKNGEWQVLPWVTASMIS